MPQKNRGGIFGTYQSIGPQEYTRGISEEVEVITKESHAKDLAEAIKTNKSSVTLNQAQNLGWFAFFRGKSDDYGIKVTATNKLDGEKLEPNSPKTP